jgi:hypothetical protein
MSQLGFFDDDEPVAPAPAPKAKGDTRVYELRPLEVNRWEYRGEVLIYNARRAGGRWASVEGIGKPEITGDNHRDVCAAIDARLGPA